MPVSVCSEQLPLLVEDHLPASLKKPLHELRVEFGENCRHKDVDRVPNNLILGVAEDFREALTCVEDLADGLFVAADVKDGRVVRE
jgi:hypothetical protein